MKSRIAAASLALFTAGFGLDEYMPIAPRTLEVDVGYSPILTRDSWDDRFEGLTGTTHSVPLQVKYGIMEGLDVALAFAYASTGGDIGEASGVRQPELGIKYALPNTDFALSLSTILPFATGDYDVPGLSTGIIPGVLYSGMFGEYSLLAKAAYQYNMEAEGVKPHDEFVLFLKPGYAANEQLGVYLGVDARATTGGDGGYAGNQFSLVPGFTYVQNETVAYEVNVPVAVYGANYPATWGVWASVYLTFPL